MWWWFALVLSVWAECDDVGPGEYRADFQGRHLLSVIQKSNGNFFDVVVSDGRLRYNVGYTLSKDCLVRPVSLAVWRKILFDVWFLSDKEMSLGLNIRYDGDRLVLGDKVELKRV